MNAKIITCPRCKEQFEWEYESKPSLGWVCRYCREELDAPGQFSHFASRPLNDMQERQFEEDGDVMYIARNMGILHWSTHSQAEYRRRKKMKR